ncbi:MAG: hypothetical protein SWH68_00470 [Thermodesulfobacteriota bacterium]|nr:hypothetical protein [Thermodesulfobacteriota bacterium]
MPKKIYMYNTRLFCALAALFTFTIMVNIAPSANAVTLLSDKTIAQIDGGQSVIIEVENPTTADVRIDHVYWGDADGMPGAPNPGYIDVRMPFENFQYDRFQYRFSTSAEARAFTESLNNADTQSATVENTETFYKAPDARDIGLNDTSAREVDYVIVTTSSQVSNYFVSRFDGTVISQDVRFRLSFPDENDPNNRTYTTTEYDPVNDEVITTTTEYGRIIMETHNTGATPLVSDNGDLLVPANTTYLKAVTSTIQLDCPMLAFSVALIPEGDTPVPANLIQGPGSPRYLPDFAAADDPANQLGNFAAKLNVRISGGNPIYVYPSDIVYPFEQ